MNPRIETFKKVGDTIAETIQSTGDIKKLRKIERARTFFSFRNQLLKINQDLIAKGKSEPLITLEYYFNDLFPEGSLSWKETRDILLFRIYEKLHDWLVEQEYDMPEEDEESNE